MKKLIPLILLTLLPFSSFAAEKFHDCLVRACRSYGKELISGDRVVRFVLTGSDKDSWIAWKGGSMPVYKSQEKKDLRRVRAWLNSKCVNVPEIPTSIPWDDLGWKNACTKF